jgi:hypothetical protein
MHQVTTLAPRALWVVLVVGNITAGSKRMVPRVVTDKEHMVAREGLIHQHLKAIDDFERDF